MRGYTLTLLGSVLATVAVALWPTQSAGEAAVEVVEDAGVTIVWTDDQRNCGAVNAATHPESAGWEGGGCFWPDLPGTVFVSPGMSDEATEYIVYHEYAHTLGATECEADQYAIEKGVDKALAYYIANC